MHLTGWRFLLFAVVGAASIILLAGIGLPGRERVEVDRHTGQKRARVLSVADAYHEARDAGDAKTALERLETRLPAFPESDVLRQTYAILRTEFEPPGDGHPAASAIRDEQQRAEAARDELKRRLREKIDAEALLALLIAAEADGAQAAALEEYFAPLITLHKGRAPDAMGPDERAAHARVPPDYLAAAASFRSRARVRARMRWLLRAYATTADAVEPLYSAYVELGRLPEAFHVLGAELAVHPERTALWRERAKVAGWLSLPREEAEAQRTVLEAEATPETRRRLVELYTFTGDPGRAVPHALILTRGSKDKEELEWPVRLALQAGEVDRALEILEKLAADSDEPAYWRERIIHYAWQDMRVDRVMAEYEWLRERYPDRDYEQRLESVLRRRNLTKPLTALLSRRLAREPDNRELETEVLRLQLSLGNTAEVRELIERRLNRTHDPRQFFTDLPMYRAAGIKGLVDRARAMALDPGLLEGDADSVLAALRVLPGAGWQSVGAALARRFAHRPYARAYLIEAVDRLPNDRVRAEEVERLALEHPDEPELLQAWIVRASWAGNIESELRGRELWLEREPDDLENRRVMADLLSALNRPADAVAHWRVLAEHGGVGSQATLRLIDALMAAGETEEAVDWLEKRAALPGTGIEDRLNVAEQLFGSEYLDRALHFYMAVLDEEPNHPLALLRAGLVRSWTNDPRGAIPFLRRRLEQTDEDAAEVRFYLGEACWAIAEQDEARSIHTRALRELLKDTLTQDIMRAKILTRLGRVDEARPIFERVLAQAPDDVDLMLDYADAMIGLGDERKARELAERAKKLAPRANRTMRAEGKVMILEQRYEEAARTLGEVLSVYGPEAGTEAERGRALELAGDSREARDAYHRSLALQPDNRDVQQAELRMWDEVARHFHANFELRSTGDDTIWSATAAGTVALPDDHTRLAAALSFTNYDAGNASTEGVAAFEFTGIRRLSRRSTLGAGLVAYPGAPGDTPLGGWAEVRFPSSEPYRVFGARVNVHTLFDDPAAAVGLGGRDTGLTLFAQGDLTPRLWALFRAKYSSLSIQSPDVQDGRVDVTTSVGFRVIEGETRTSDALDVSRNELPGQVGPDLMGSPALTRGPLLSVWVTYQAIRLLDGQELAAFLPIGTGFDYLSVGARSDLHLAPGLGLTLEGYAGSDLKQSDFFFGAAAALTYRPSNHLDLSLKGSYGSAVGRADNADTVAFSVLFSYRW